MKSRSRPQASKSAAVPKADSWATLNIALALLLALVVGQLHKTYVETLFENERYFSALTETEREMSFRSEQALYYSYYKDMLSDFREHKSFFSGLRAGLQRLISNNMTEYPSSINVLQRFNIYPEVILASLHTLFGARLPRNCYTVNRKDPSLPPLSTCSGPGEPVVFYVNAVFFLQALLGAGIVLLCWYASGRSLLAPVVAGFTLFFNFTEFTRVMWTPPLRESFSVPFLPYQILAVLWALRSDQLSRRHYIALVGTTFLFALPWQFAQFALLTQCASLFAVYLLDLISPSRLRALLLCQLCALAAVWLLQAGSLFLLVSFIVAFILVVLCMLPLHSRLAAIDSLSVWLRRILVGLTVVGLTLAIKAGWSFLFAMKDDTHIIEILRSKWDSGIQDFHAQLYVCSPEFDFLSAEYFTMSVTLFMPAAALAWLFLVHREFAPLLFNSARTYQSRPDWAYLVLQAALFFVMAALIMRLKLFMGLAFFVLTGLLPTAELYESFAAVRNKTTLVVIAALFILGGSLAGRGNITQQLARMGEMENIPLEQLIDFARSTPPQTSFAGNMPITAIIKCAANRPIVNHPHYEDAGIRNRTYFLYRSYGHFPDQQVWRPLLDYNTTMLIIDGGWCDSQREYGCNVRDIYDIDYPKFKAYEEFCVKWQRDYRSEYFEKVFDNGHYKVLRVLGPHEIKRERNRKTASTP